MSTSHRPRRPWVYGLALVAVGIVASIVNTILYAPFDGSEDRADESVLHIVALAVMGAGLALVLGTGIVAWVVDKKNAVGGASSSS